MKLGFTKNKLVLLVVILLSVFLFYSSKAISPENGAPSKYSEIEEIKYLELSGEKVEIEIVADEQSRIKGLSGREKLEKNQGMFFVFENTEKHSFWMKDVKFPIDIIWLDEDLRVVHIEKSVGPDSYPQVFVPITPAKYVLEVLANFSSETNLKIGEIALFSSS